MICITRPQKRTINVLTYDAIYKPLKFHLYFPSFTFLLKEGSFFAYAEMLNVPDTGFYEYHTIGKNLYVLPFHDNLMANKSLCLRIKVNNNMKKLIDYFWRSTFEKEAKYLECFQKWQEYDKISWEGIFKIFSDQLDVI